MTLTIIADDLTGACDAGAVFCGGGPVAVFVAPDAPGPAWPVAAVDSESRGLAPADAARRMRELAGRLEPRLSGGVVLKKIDSTLRGPIGAELDALLAGRDGGALLCPAFPGQRRVVRDGVLTVDGVPAHESAVGRDPDYPGATSDVLDILRAQSGRPLRRVPLDEVRDDGGRLARALGEVAGGIAVADAETDADLAALARAALDHGSVLLAGSAGLATALSAALGREGAPPPLPHGRAWLVVAGSRHPATRAQLDALVSAGAALVRVSAATGGASAAAVSPAVEALRAGRPAIVASAEGDGAGPEAIAASLAAAASRVLAAVRPALTCATGGETAHALLRALGATRLDLAGAPASGLALGEVVSAGGPGGLLLLTKAGGFGPPDLFIQLMRQ
jgi:uncharacterized protein YgbK (DUF1537 family)